MIRRFMIFSLFSCLILYPIFVSAQENINKIEEIQDEFELDEEALEALYDVPTAMAFIEGTQEGSEIYGEVELVEENNGVSVYAEIYDAPAGKHGFHIHENGSCADSGNAAGGHFNPDGVQHGLATKDGLKGAHAGDMGNVEIDENGEGVLEVFLPGLSLAEGKYNVVSKAIILHEKEDDFGQPTGNAGGRIGCGVIELIEF